VLSLQQSSLAFAEEMKGIGTLRSLVTAGPVDIESQYGGVFFYAVHQVDLICNLVEAAPVSVSTVRKGDDGIATITFDSGAFAVVHCLKDAWGPGFLASAYGSEKAAHATLGFDQNPYLAGIQRFCRMFETGVEPAAPLTYLRPVAVLAAMQKSFDTKRPARVKKIPKL
jgi:predicted dehydrogenase